VYRPRRPRESPLSRLVERHLEELLRTWPERFLRQHGPLFRRRRKLLTELGRAGAEAVLELVRPVSWCSGARTCTC
jgi:hypothetical protein